MARKLAVGHRTWHGGGTALGVVVTITAKFPKPTLSKNIGRCTVVTVAVTIAVPPQLPLLSAKK